MDCRYVHTPNEIYPLSLLIIECSLYQFWKCLHYILQLVNLQQCSINSCPTTSLPHYFFKSLSWLKYLSQCEKPQLAALIWHRFSWVSTLYACLQIMWLLQPSLFLFKTWHILPVVKGRVLCHHDSDVSLLTHTVQVQVALEISTPFTFWLPQKSPHLTEAVWGCVSLGREW